MDSRDQVPSTEAPMPQDAATSNQAAGMELFKQGLGLLRGSGAQQDFSMAAARLLDAADLNHTSACYFCALLYFSGIGVARNNQNASQYANQYLEADPKGVFAATAKSIIDGSLGTENAKKLLLEKPMINQHHESNKPASSNKKYIIATAVLTPLILVSGLTFFSLSKTGSPLAPSSIAGLKVDLLLPTDDAEQALKEALSIAATLQSDAQVVIQKQKATQQTAQDAQAKTELDQKNAQEAQIKSEQDRQRAEAEARVSAAAQPGRLSASMVTSAREAARRGEFDRANGILEGVLAADPGNREAESLKVSIRQARSQAVNNLQIR